MCKQANRRGRPTAEQVKQKEDLLKQFLNIILSNKSKIDAVFANKKAKKLINEEDLIVSNLDRKLILLKNRLDEENIKYEQYFDKDALIQLNSIILTTKNIASNCPNCRELVKIDNSIAMGCDKCHVWFHLKCQNLKSAAKNWKCLSCSQS